MLAADQAVPQEVLAIPGIGDERQMQIGDLLDGPGQFGQRRQGLPVIVDLPLGRARSSGSHGRQEHQSLGLQPFNTHCGRTQTPLPFAVPPVGALAKFLDRRLARGRIGPQRPRRQASQQVPTNPTSTHAYSV